MSYIFLSIISTILTGIGYIPEIYNLSYSVITKTVYKEHSSKNIWLIWISSSIFGLIYAVLIKDYYIATYSAISAFLNLLIFLLHNIKEYQNNYS
jgi:hypothetical protein